MKVQITGGRVITFGDPIKDGVYSVEAWKSKRSKQQNKLLHVVFREASLGMAVILDKPVSTDFAKSLLKQRFLSSTHPTLGGYVIPTSKLNTSECVKFIEECVQYSAEKLRHYIELPSDWQSSITEEK